MSLLLVIKKYDSPKNATAIAALAPTMQRVITNRKAHGQLWNGRSKVKQLLDMMKQTMFTEDYGKLNIPSLVNWPKSPPRCPNDLDAATDRHRRRASMPSGHGNTSIAKAYGKSQGAAMRPWTASS